MHVSPAKRYVWQPRKAWLPKKCHYWADRRTNRWQTKWSLCAAMLRRWHNKIRGFPCIRHYWHVVPWTAASPPWPRWVLVPCCVPPRSEVCRRHAAPPEGSSYRSQARSGLCGSPPISSFPPWHHTGRMWWRMAPAGNYIMQRNMSYKLKSAFLNVCNIKSRLLLLPFIWAKYDKDMLRLKYDTMYMISALNR